MFQTNCDTLSIMKTGMARWSSGTAAADAATAAGLSWAAWFICVGMTGCGGSVALVLPNEQTDPVQLNRYELVVRFAQISDAQIVDEESPARLTVAADLSNSAWRAQEAYSIHLLDGMVRTINKMHVALRPIDFVIHTGDATDNTQQNELEWFITAMDGGRINPLSGVDDRAPEDKPDPLLDPHAPFEAQGLYQQGEHGPLADIAWYAVAGNHDRFAIGVFPIIVNLFGQRYAPLPLPIRLPVFFPILLDPLNNFTIGLISPAHPGPPPDVNFPKPIVANSARRFLTTRQFVEAHVISPTKPPGHGFDPNALGKTWYSTPPRPGLRLIVLNSATPLYEQPTLVYSEGAISNAQRLFLRDELAKAQQAGEIVVVATHHPSDSLDPVLGTAFTPQSLRSLLNEFPCVAIHIAGHWHTNVVIDRGGYIEMVTGSIIDAPQQGRVIEIWRDRSEPTSLELRYRMFSHLEVFSSPDENHLDMFEDPLFALRQRAAELAESRGRN